MNIYATVGHAIACCTIRFQWFLMSCLVVYCFAGVSTSYAETIAVIVHESNPIENVSIDYLVSIFSGNVAKWSDGQNMFIVQKPSNQLVRRQFDALILDPTGNRLPSESKAAFARRVMHTHSDNATISAVKSLSNSIGFVSLESLNEDYSGAIYGVRVLKVESSTPGDVGYRLHY